MWGRNDNGQLGLGVKSDPVSVPEAVRLPSGTVSHVSLGGAYTAAAVGVPCARAMPPSRHDAMAEAVWPGRHAPQRGMHTDGRNGLSLARILNACHSLRQATTLPSVHMQTARSGTLMKGQQRQGLTGLVPSGCVSFIARPLFDRLRMVAL